MITDSLKNLSKYSAKIPAAVAEFVAKNQPLEALADGRYEIDGENVYASVSTYETKKEIRFEAHEKYADIQLVIEGAEKFVLAETLKPECEYDEAKDIVFGAAENARFETLSADGTFFFIPPLEAHAPGLSLGDAPQRVRKIVFKVKVAK